MSSLKDKLSKVTGRSTTESQDEDSSSSTTEKYRLKVTAGTSYENSTANTVVVNSDDCILDQGTRVAVRIREYQGIPGHSVAQSAYFEDSAHPKDTYSIAFSWVPKEDVSADDLVWGIELVNPIRDRIPSRFITTAFEICKRFVDSSLNCDPYADQPWVNGAILCGSAMTFSLGGKRKEAVAPASVLVEGGLEDGESVRQDAGIPADEAKRRKFFAIEENRKNFTFEQGRCYQFDFHNGYIDWKDYALKLPGFSLNVLRWIDARTHTVRFVMKNRKSGLPYLVVTIRLLFGEELDDALEGEEHVSSQGVAEMPTATDASSNTDQGATASSKSPGTVAIESDHEQAEIKPGRARSPGRVIEHAFSGRESRAPSAHDNQVDNSISTQKEPDVEREATARESRASSAHDVHAETTEPDIEEHQMAAESEHISSSEPILDEKRESDALSTDNTTSELEKLEIASQERGFKHSIEESLCGTASVDGRNRPSNVLGL
ncbi:hypothetical protein AAFC00_000141 [Neodothiora populina]|uniref:Domain of unknown function at the cortex 1 domain-containing protein n=1 Tax=Neodothiora populina TaxID=2781224 RepID=A0ABR3P2U4_9PEZI